MNSDSTQTQQPGVVVETQYFNHFADSVGDFNPFAERGWRNLSKCFVQMVRPQQPLNLLDIGCGSGQSRQIYRQHCRQFTGVDLAEGLLEIARKKYPLDQWIQGDARRLDFTDATFDVVCFSAVLHHIPNFQEALKEAYRLLIPGGKVFAYDPNVLHPAMALFRHPSSPLYSPKGVSPNEQPLLPKRLKREFATAGFVQIQQRCQSDIPYRYVAPKLLNALLGVYNTLDLMWEKVGIGRICGTLVITSGTKPAIAEKR